MTYVTRAMLYGEAADLRSPRFALQAERVSRLPLGAFALLFRFAAGLAFAGAGAAGLGLGAAHERWLEVAPAAQTGLALALLVGGTTLALGLAARASAAFLLALLLPLQILVQPGAWAEHAAWAVLLLFLIANGSGSLAADGLLARRKAAPTPRRRGRP